MNSVFSEQILADKLSKLNNSQQCIETLSHWCIFHRSKAGPVVTTWDRQFHVSEFERKIWLLYLANDILQNSKRKGNEFVSEFWKVLPKALKSIFENEDERGKKTVCRLVEIWEERRVFGSRAKGLKELMLEDQVPPPLEFKRKRSRSVRIVKRDSHSIRTKLTIGGAAEKIVSAFHLVSSENVGEDEEMIKCKSAIQRVRKMEEEVDLACNKVKDPKRKMLSKEVEEQENILKHSIEKFKVVEANRNVLVSQLREALNEQESELENIRTQMQVAQAQAEEASNMRKRLDDEKYIADHKQPTGAPPTPDVNTKTSTKNPKKTAAAIAAEVADKLTASTSSQLIMSSVLSSFAAQEAKNAGLTNFSPAPNNNAPPQQPLVAPPPTTYQSILVPHSTLQSQNPPPQIQYHILPNPSSQQYLGSYSYGGVAPPPPQPHYMSNMSYLNQQQMQQQLSQQQPTQVYTMMTPQQPPVPPSFRPLGVQNSGMVYYGQQNHSQ